MINKIRCQSDNFNSFQILTSNYRTLKIAATLIFSHRISMRVGVDIAHYLGQVPHTGLRAFIKGHPIENPSGSLGIFCTHQSLKP